MSLTWSETGNRQQAMSRIGHHTWMDTGVIGCGTLHINPLPLKSIAVCAALSTWFPGCLKFSVQYHRKWLSAVDYVINTIVVTCQVSSGNYLCTTTKHGASAKNVSEYYFWGHFLGYLAQAVGTHQVLNKKQQSLSSFVDITSSTFLWPWRHWLANDQVTHQFTKKFSFCRQSVPCDASTDEALGRNAS
jgi:hypothetical protein